MTDRRLPAVASRQRIAVVKNCAPKSHPSARNKKEPSACKKTGGRKMVVAAAIVITLLSAVLYAVYESAESLN